MEKSKCTMRILTINKGGHSLSFCWLKKFSGICEHCNRRILNLIPSFSFAFSLAFDDNFTRAFAMKPRPSRGTTSNFANPSLLQSVKGERGICLSVSHFARLQLLMDFSCLTKRALVLDRWLKWGTTIRNILTAIIPWPSISYHLKGSYGTYR